MAPDLLAREERKEDEMPSSGVRSQAGYQQDVRVALAGLVELPDLARRPR